MKKNIKLFRDLQFHHYGIAVRSFKEALKFYKNLDFKLSKKIIDKVQNVEIILCTSKNYPAVELIKPINKKSPISKMVEDKETSIYHVCYEAKKKNFDIKKFLRNFDYVCISKPKPDKLFQKRYTGFYFIRNIGLIEILYN